jgi:hypothetical protein
MTLSDLQRRDAHRIFLKYRRGGPDILLHHLKCAGVRLDNEGLHRLTLELTEVLDFCRPIAESLRIGLLDRELAMRHIVATYPWMDRQCAGDALEEV